MVTKQAILKFQTINHQIMLIGDNYTIAAIIAK